LIDLRQTRYRLVNMLFIDPPTAFESNSAGSSEYGQMLDEETAKLMMETNTSICLQPNYDDKDAIPHEPGSFQEAKYDAMNSGTDIAFALAKKHNLLFGFGTDTRFMRALAARLWPTDCQFGYDKSEGFLHDFVCSSRPSILACRSSGARTGG